MKAPYLLYIFFLLLYGGIFVVLLPPFTAVILLFILFLPRAGLLLIPQSYTSQNSPHPYLFFCDFLMLWAMLRWIIRIEFFLQQQVLIEQTLLVFVIIYWSNIFSFLTGNMKGTDSPDKILYYFIWFGNLFLRVGVERFLPGRYYLYWHLNYEEFSRIFLIPIFAIALIRSVFYLLFSREHAT